MESMDRDSVRYLRTVYNGLSGIFTFYFQDFSDTDAERFLKVSEYLNDILNRNIYGYSDKEIAMLSLKGTKIMKKLLGRYGVTDEELSYEKLQFMELLSNSIAEVLLERMDERMKEEILLTVLEKEEIERNTNEGIVH